jgi:6-phosphogluconate dehydrogenase
MQLGMIGLGRMGSNMVRRLLKKGQECVVYDVHASAANPLVDDGATKGARNLSPSSNHPGRSG